LVVSAIVVGVLTWLHVFCAVGWFGGDLVMMMGLDPKLGGLSPAARSEVITRVFPGLNRLEMVFAGSTVAFGFFLLLSIAGGDPSVLSPTTSWGLAITVGAPLGLIAFLLEVAVHSPATRKVIAFETRGGAQGDPSHVEQASRYERRAETAEKAILVLLLVAFTFMVAAGQL